MAEYLQPIRSKRELEKIKEKLEVIISELEEKVNCVCPKCESKVVLCEYG